MLSLATTHLTSLEKATAHALSPGGVVSGPVALSALLMLTVIGPDHLATLVSLCASKRGWEAFQIGTYWGIGHTIGIMVIVPILMVAQSFYGGGAAEEQWEHIGNYLVGIMMIFCGIYFYTFQSRYFVQQENGSYVAQACTCCSSSDTPNTEEENAGSRRQSRRAQCRSGEIGPIIRNKDGVRAGKVKFCKDFKGKPGSDVKFKAEAIPEDVETAPLLPDKADGKYLVVVPNGERRSLWCGWMYGSRKFESTVLGLLQGFCCPSGLQSMVILAHISRSFSPLVTCLFAFAFYVGSAVGSGVVTFLIAECTHLGVGAILSPIMVYKTCCLFTVALGISWMILNATGTLENIA